MSRTKFAAEFNAFNFAYGVNPDTPAFEVIAGNNAAGTYGVTLGLGVVYTPDGVAVSPQVGVPITIGSGASTEIVTPTSVVNLTPTQYGTCVITAAYGFGHGAGDLVRSGDYGLQEAAAAAKAYGDVVSGVLEAAPGVYGNFDLIWMCRPYRDVDAHGSRR